MYKIKQVLKLNPDLSVACVYILCILFVFYPLFSGYASLNWDAFDLWLSWKHFIVEEFFNANLPLWNPYHVGGFPQQGDTMTWYPISWMFGFLNGSYNLNALNFEYIFHIFVAGYGFYTFSSKFVQSRKIRFLLGLSYMFSGFMIGNAQHVSWIISAAWMPWLFHYLFLILSEKNFRNILKFSIVGYLFFSGGYLAIFFVSIYLIIIAIAIKFIYQKKWIVIRKSILYLCISFIIIILLSLPLLYSAIEIFPLFNRSSNNLNTDNFNLATGATPWNGILAIIQPFASGIYNITEFEFGSFSAFFGSIPFLLPFTQFKTIFKDKKLIFLFLASFFFIICSMGDISPLRKIISYLPLLDLFRYPTLFRLFFIFTFLILSGIVFEKNKEKFNSTKFKQFLFTFFIVFSIASLTLSFSINKGQFKTYLNSFSDLKFLADLDVKSRIFFNLIFIALLSLSSFLVLKYRKLRNPIQVILGLWAFEIIFVTITSAPHTVFHYVNVKFADKKIDYQAKNYPQIDKNHQENEMNFWQDYLDFTWQGKTLFLKQFSENWYNPLEIKQKKTNTFFINSDTLKKLPLIAIVDFKSHIYNKTIDSKVKLKIKNNSNFEIIHFDKNHRNHYLLLKQRLIPAWKIYSNQSTLNQTTVGNGMILIPLKNASEKITFKFENKAYLIYFWISILCFIVISLILILMSRKKIFILITSGILLTIFLFNSKDRIFKIERIQNIKSHTILNLKDKNFHMLDFWNQQKPNLLILQNTAKTDSEISFIEHFYPKKRVLYKYNNQTYELREKTSESKRLFYQKQNFKGTNQFQIDLRQLISKYNLKNKVIGFELIYQANSDSKFNFWLSQLRKNIWVKGKSWKIGNHLPKNNQKDKIIVEFIDLSQFGLKANDDLKLYLWSSENTKDFKIKKLNLFKTHY